MHQTFPDLYSPERPFDRRDRSPDKQPMSQSKHIYKLMGSLYREKPRKETPPPRPIEEDYKTKVLKETDKSNKKVRSTSSKAARVSKAMSDTVDSCRNVQHNFTDTLKSLNRTARLAFLDSIGCRNEFSLPIELLDDERNPDVESLFQSLSHQYRSYHATGEKFLGFNSSSEQRPL